MHFSRLAVVALPILGATASVVPRWDNPCNSGSLQCCQQTIANNSCPPWLVQTLALVGLTVANVAPAVGLTCTTLNIGLGQTCQSNTVCCTGNNQQVGLVNFSTGCTPVIL